MPWSPQDAHKHNHSISGGKSARQWSDVANSVLERTGDEGRAIRSANAVAGRKHASGGLVPHMADGGIGAVNIEDPARMTPYFIRQEGRGWGANPFTKGLLNSPVPGRTDQLPTSVASNSHVIPADVIAGLGQGNTLAGSNIMEHILKTGPWATTNMPLRHGRGVPSAPRAFHPQAKKGGAEHKPTKIIAAGGEYLIEPDIVRAIGGGDIDKGHKLLDNMIRTIRKQVAKQMLKLPGPKQ